ncbi:MAG: hypothetical protein J1F18_13730 [Lachnospiraceae bacterium]|nr:hypothetical protein [Lachnospiraceae bacterium]
MYQKEIIYMGLYKDGNRMGSAGFLKVENRNRESRLSLKIQNVPLGINGRFPVRIYNGSGWKETNGIAIQDGGGSWEESMAEETDRTVIQVMLSGGYKLEGKSKSAPSVPDMRTSPEVIGETERMPKAVAEEVIHSSVEMGVPGAAQLDVEMDVPETMQSPVTAETLRPVRVSESENAQEPVIVTEELPQRSRENPVTMPQSVPDHNLKEDKWEQILSSYENIHPYGDERVYVKLEPKDFVILQSKYQHLVNNSFLLHGFYNYRYIILGKEQDYYLGVPGVFYEREKMVAQMFGFEAFECPGGNVRGGEFGYYLRKVEL